MSIWALSNIGYHVCYLLYRIPLSSSLLLNRIHLIQGKLAPGVYSHVECLEDSRLNVIPNYIPVWNQSFLSSWLVAVHRVWSTLLFTNNRRRKIDSYLFPVSMTRKWSTSSLLQDFNLPSRVQFPMTITVRLFNILTQYFDIITTLFNRYPPNLIHCYLCWRSPFVTNWCCFKLE